jgi:hypothetical protein
MIMDRDLQREILEGLRESYPDEVSFREIPGSEHPHFTGNLYYLAEQELVEAEILRTARGREVKNARITADGLDFLEDDGGLEAVRQSMTLRLAEDQVKEILYRRIDKSSGDKAKKEELKGRVEELSGDLFRQYLVGLLEQVLNNSMDPVPMIENSLSRR